MQEEDHQQSSTLSLFFKYVCFYTMVTISPALGKVDFLANVT